MDPQLGSKNQQYEMLVIGTSLGGLTAVEQVLSPLPAEFPLAIAMVQHRKKNSQELLGELLIRHSRLPVYETEDKQTIKFGRIYIAPPDYHLLVDRGHFVLSIEPEVNYARPSIDLLFESAADIYRERVIGLILTGANSDGAAGLAVIKKYGGLTIVQDPATAESRVMPDAAIAAVTPDKILPLEEIGAFLVRLISHRGTETQRKSE